MRMSNTIYGKDILDAVYELVGRVFEKQYSTGSASTASAAASDESTGTAGDESGHIPNMSAVKERVITEFEERLPFLIAACCSELSLLDLAYRKAFGEEKQHYFSGLYIGIDDVFPLSERFVSPVTLYCASMILTDVDSEMSDTLFDKYADSVSSISASVPFNSESITEKYIY